MKIVREHYPLTEVARKIAEHEGYEDTLLDCLRHGILVASVEAPSQFPSHRDIPKSYWIEYGLEDFEVLDNRPPRRNLPSDFCVDREAFIDSARDDLKTILCAAVERDVSIISERVHKVVLSRLSCESFEQFENWSTLIEIGYELTTKLEDE